MIATTVSHPQPLAPSWSYARQVVTGTADVPVLDKLGIPLPAATLQELQMNTVKVVHNTDLGNTIDIVDGKIEVVSVNPDTEGVVYVDNRGMFTQLKDGGYRIPVKAWFYPSDHQSSSYAVID